MVKRSETEIGVRDLIASDILEKPLSSLYQKNKRKKDKIAGEVARLIKKGEEYQRVIADVKAVKQEKARTLRQGINRFKELHPRLGKKLEGIIQETRTERGEVLVYRLEEGYKLSPVDYIRVLRNLGLSREAADAMYPHLKELSDKLKKLTAEDAEREILLK